MKLRLIGPLGLSSLAAGAAAIPMNYEIAGTGNGLLGATPFSGAHFAISIQLDTSLIQNPASGIYATPLSTATLTIAGLGTTTFTGQKQMVVNQNNTGFGNGLVSLTGGGQSLLIFQQDAFQTYNLGTPIGPINTNLAYWLWDGSGSSPNPLDTEVGALTWTGSPPPISNSTFTATPVPEPASLLGLLGAAMLIRRRRG